MAQLRTITPSGKKTEIIDQTNLLTPGSAKVKLAVQVDAGSVAYDGVLNPTDPGLNLLSSLQDGLTLAMFRILLPAPPDLTEISQSAPGANVSGVIFGYFAAWQYEEGDIIVDAYSGSGLFPSTAHLQQAQYAFVGGSTPTWNHAGGYTNDGSNINAWLDLGPMDLVGGYAISCPFLLYVEGVMADLQPGMLLKISTCSIPGFDTPSFAVPVLDFGPYPGSIASKLVYMTEPVEPFTYDDTVTTVTLYRANNPTIHSFEGYVVEHVPAKLGIGKICAFSGKIEISGPITTVLGDPWPAAGGSAVVPGLTGGGGGGVAGWLAPVWTEYDASGVVPITAQAIKALGGSGGIALTLTAGGTYYIVKYDNTAGPISLVYASATVYELTGYLQFVILSWDGSEFMEMAGN